MIFLLFALISSTSAGFGRSSYHDGSAALNEINQSENIAAYAAQSAVASSVGRDYSNQLATTQQYTNQFTAPVTKQQTAEAFRAVLHQQQGSLISAALANAAPAIAHAGATAARDNFDQAYAQAEGDRLHGSARDQGALDDVYRTGSDLSNRRQAAEAAAHYRNAAKSQETATNAAAIQAVHGISDRDRQSSYGK